MYNITRTFLYVNKKIKNIRICFQSGSDAALFPDAGLGLAWATVQEIDRFIGRFFYIDPRCHCGRGVPVLRCALRHTDYI